MAMPLRNEPIYDGATLEWLQKVIGTDIYGASTAIKEMIRKGVARSTAKSSRVYEVREPLTTQPDMPGELVPLLPVLQRKSRLSNADVRGILGLTRITAARLLKELLVAGQWLASTGKRGVGAFYSPGSRLLHHSHTVATARESEPMPPEADPMKTIKDMPEHSRPREKLREKGASALTDEELVAAILGMGTAGVDVRTMARQVAGLIREHKTVLTLDHLQEGSWCGTCQSCSNPVSL